MIDRVFEYANQGCTVLYRVFVCFAGEQDPETGASCHREFPREAV